MQAVNYTQLKHSYEIVPPVLERGSTQHQEVQWVGYMEQDLGRQYSASRFAQTSIDAIHEVQHLSWEPLKGTCTLRRPRWFR